jgi:hypothetical protein
MGPVGVTVAGTLPSFVPVTDAMLRDPPLSILMILGVRHHASTH